MSIYAVMSACLTLISQQPGMEGARDLTDWPVVIVGDHEAMTEQGWLASYNPIGNAIFLRPADEFSSQNILESVICHEVYHFAEWRILGVRGLDCSEADAYAVALTVLEANPAPEIIADYIAGQRTLQARHQAACEGGVS